MKFTVFKSTDTVEIYTSEELIYAGKPVKAEVWMQRFNGETVGVKYDFWEVTFSFNYGKSTYGSEGGVDGFNFGVGILEKYRFETRELCREKAEEIMGRVQLADIEKSKGHQRVLFLAHIGRRE